MKYIVATFNIDCQVDIFQMACDLVAEAAGVAGFEAFEECEQGIKGYAQKNLFDKTRLDEELLSIGIPNVLVTYNINNVEDKDWNESWEEAGFEPINIDDKCVIYDAKHTDKTHIATSGKLNVFIETRQAFGTGTHETTRMVVSELMKRDLKGLRFLDCGCGTGILGIVASMMGASEIVAYDIDEWSVDNARLNARMNERGNITVLHGDASVLKKVDGGFDFIAANINRNILLADMPTFFDKMNSNATLALSGFYESDIDLLMATANKLGLSEQARRTNGDWACLVLKKP